MSINSIQSTLSTNIIQSTLSTNSITCTMCSCPSDDDDVDTAALLQYSMSELVALSGDSDDMRAAFVRRVYRSAVPLHVLMLLLLGLACLLPSGDDEFSCFLANNFERSLAVMIRYNDGSPPV